MSSSHTEGFVFENLNRTKRLYLLKISGEVLGAIIPEQLPPGFRPEIYIKRMKVHVPGGCNTRKQNN